jgi:hypothetical protein
MTMTQNPPPDALDKLLSDFFKRQMKQPWPPAPVPPGPSPLSALDGRVSLNGKPTLAEPAPAARTPADPITPARLTLAASVALLLGGCWYLSGVWQPTAAPQNVAQPGAPAIDARKMTAEGAEPLDKIREDKARNVGPMGPPTVDDPFQDE